MVGLSPPPSFLKVGEVMIFYDGMKVYMNGDYPAVWLDGKSQHIHRLEWIKHFGKIPKGYIVHHKDENKMNWSIENLELLSRSSHIKKHSETVHRKGVQVVGIFNNQETKFESIEEAAALCGTYPALIQRVMNGTQKQTKGWRFRKVR